MHRFLVSVLVLAACRPGDGPPLIEAHRTGAGYWPENSRLGLSQAMLEGFDGIEVDLVLTRDLVPVLHHDPAVSVEHCVHTDGSAVDEGTLIRDLDYATLRRDYRCGGIAVDGFDQALLAEAPIASFDEMLELLRDLGPADQLIHLDIKQEPGMTLPAATFAEAILGRWFDAEVPQPMHVSSNLPDVLAAFREEAAGRARSVETTLIWPRFPVGASVSGVALEREAAILKGQEDYVVLARDAGVDHLALNWELASKHLALAAHREGIGIMLWTPNDPDVMRRLARHWPVDVLITDFPGEAP